MARSYSHLCRKAGIPPPTGFADIPKPTRSPRHRMTAAEKIQRLKVFLDAMVEHGEIARTPDGRYYMP